MEKQNVSSKKPLIDLESDSSSDLEVNKSKAIQEVSELPDDPIHVQAEKEAKLKPVSEMLEEIRRKQQEQQPAPTRSKWNVQPKNEKVEPIIDILEDTRNTEERGEMFPIKDEISEYTVAHSEKKEAPAVVPDSQLVVPTFKVSSDQGSDCAYFSGDEGEESINFNLDSEKYQT